MIRKFLLGLRGSAGQAAYRLRDPHARYAPLENKGIKVNQKCADSKPHPDLTFMTGVLVFFRLCNGRSPTRQGFIFSFNGKTLDRIFKKKRKIMTTNTLSRYGLYAVAVVVFTLVAGCARNYGGFSRDQRVLEAFESSQLNTDYKYFYNGHHNQTYAIVGIESKYRLESQFWRQIEPNTEEFRQVRSRIWEDYGQHTYGAHLLDPAGNKMGVWYSSIYVANVKFHADNRIDIMLDRPYLWGPDDGGVSGARIP
jgi:hypothetical protein